MQVRGVTLDALQKHAGDVDGPFGSHLRLQAATLNQKPTLKTAFRQILQTGGCEDNSAFEELYSAGLVSGESLNDARVRCQLYTQYFQERL